MQSTLRTEKNMPYCPGCGHTIATNNLVKALDKLKLAPGDIIMVSDIGCCGLVDPLLTCHTIHGLHGRAAALGMGVTLGLNNPNKKVIAIQGDGGATIGLQNLLEASRLNVNLTLLVQNNMVYGMTGGQISGLSSCEFKETILPESFLISPYDICKLANVAGASFVNRVLVNNADLSNILCRAINTNGFSLVEIVGLCTPYGIDNVKELHQKSPKEVSYENTGNVFYANPKPKVSLFESIQNISTKYESKLAGRLSLIIAGSAGEGVQVAADLLAQAAIASGLKTTKKGEYPITVGTGFSVAEVIISREDIHYTGIEHPDVMIIVSIEGLKKTENRLSKETLLIIDKDLPVPADVKNIYSGNFRKVSGRKGAVLTAIGYWLNLAGIIPMDGLREVVSTHKHKEQLLPLLEKVNLV